MHLCYQIYAMGKPNKKTTVLPDNVLYEVSGFVLIMFFLNSVQLQQYPNKLITPLLYYSAPAGVMHITLLLPWVDTRGYSHYSPWLPDRHSGFLITIL
jgi:hypothetical protein